MNITNYFTLYIYNTKKKQKYFKTTFQHAKNIILFVVFNVSFKLLLDLKMFGLISSKYF